MKRPLLWLAFLGLCGIATYMFLPSNIVSNLKKETSLPNDTVSPSPVINPPEEKAPPPARPPIETKPPALSGKFVKRYLEFYDSKNFYKTMTESGLNPTLIMQLAALRRRLSSKKVTRVDLLYSDYVKDDSFNPKNSKVIAVRIYHDTEIKTFFSKNEHGEIYFYDEEGNAPELAMDRFPLASYERITSPFNPHRLHPITHRIRPHNGTDFKAPYGAPIHSTGDGIVKFAGWQRGYGKVVIIEHANHYETRYAHLSAINTSVGEKIKRGQVIGKLGNTGASTGAHLHYEVRKEGTPYDPMTIKLPSSRPLAANYMYAWHYRCNQYQRAMEEIATKGSTNL